MGVTPIMNAADYEKAINGSKPAVFDFGAEWCGPCRFIKPIFERLSQEFESVAFYTIDIDQNSEIARDIRSVPTFRAYKNGQKVTEFSGASEVKLRETISSLS